MDPARISRHSAVAGTLIWIAWQVLADPFPAAALFALSPLVLVPLLLRPLLVEDNLSPLLRALAWGQLPCALLLPFAMRFEPGAAGLLGVLPWAIWTALLAVESLRRLLAWVRVEGLRGIFRSGEIAVIAALGFPVIGSGWLICDRLGLQPLGFSPLIVLLTAAHFHHAGFTLPISAGYLARTYPGSLHRFNAWAVVLGVPLVAIGITLSPLLEWLSAWLTAGAGIIVAIGLLQRSRVVPSVPAMLFGFSGACLMAGMIFAGSYAFSEYKGVPWPDIMSMVQLHGAVNALGFGLLGAWGWHSAPPSPPATKTT